MAMLEGRCAYEAARKVDQDDLLRLEPLHERLQAHATAGNIDQYYATNALIHEAVQALADNNWLSDLIDNLRKVLSLSRHKSLVYPGRMGESDRKSDVTGKSVSVRVDLGGARTITKKKKKKKN